MTNLELQQQTTTQEIDKYFQQAVAEHRVGHMEKAEQGYLAILQLEPNHPAANHNLGLLTMNTAQMGRALNYFVVAINTEPSDSQYWLSYIEALLKAGELETARQVLDMARQHGLEGNVVDNLDEQLSKANSKNLGGQYTLKKTMPVSEAVTRNRNSPSPPQKKSSNKKNKFPSPQEMNELVALFCKGQLAEALPIAEAMTQHNPEHEFGWKALGAILKQLGRGADALTPMRKAASISPNDVEIHNNLGITLQEMGNLKEAEASYRRALEINRNHAESHNNLGSCLQAMERYADAEDSYKRALNIDPNYIKAYGNLGAALNELGRYDEAEVYHRKTIQLNQDNAEAHYNLGITLKELGRFDEAEISCHNAILIKPNYVDAHFNLGNILYELGRNAEAEASYRHALKLEPNFTNALDNLALLYNVQNKSTMALNTIQQSLNIQETELAKTIFVTCIKHLHFTHEYREMHPLLIRALTAPWGRSSELARTSTELVKLDPQINQSVLKANLAWPTRLVSQELLGKAGISILAANDLLSALLDSTPICDVEMERFLSMIRNDLLEAACTSTNIEDDTALRFYCALTKQCFINEYVFSFTRDEIKKAESLRNTIITLLKTGVQIPVTQLIAVAAYFPLSSLPLSNRLLEFTWATDVEAVLQQQIREPLIEQQLRTTLTRLTDIENEISIQVQSQYEESPYPRWIKTAPASKAKNIITYLSQKFPRAAFNRQLKTWQIDVLIAGCGTGQQSIASAQRIQNVKLLAVDLSSRSLAYAKRKTQELGLSSIEYAQADLLKLGSTGLSFDIIESSGVLHHMENPWIGWKTLLSALRPNGFMKLGFYSGIARRDIVRIRNFITDHGYTSSLDDIRRCRQDLMNLNEREDFGAILTSPDFFSTSTCRDLLFHVQEHRFTLTEIATFLHENRLTFLGFEIEAYALHAYKQRFPNDLAAINLEQWQIFEQDNPDTFANMYQFWIQKTDT